LAEREKKADKLEAEYGELKGWLERNS